MYFVLTACTASVYPSPGSNPKPAHDVAITNVSVPSSCVAGDTVSLTVSVVDQGVHREAFTVKLTDQTNGKEITSQEVALAKGWKDGSEGVADLIFDPNNLGINYFANQVWMERDVNGDNIDDILISAPNWNNCRGQVYLYYGGRNIDPCSPNLVFSGVDPNTHLGGYAGTCSCDTNNDGYEDVVIGARGTHNYDGRVYIFYGGPTIDTQADKILDGETGQGGNFGLTVTSGDIDNDGHEDILVGAQMHDHGRGRVYLFWGGEAMDTTADLVFEGEGYPECKPVIGYGSQKLMVQGWFGRKIDVGGDVNGDGYKDILIGARHAPDHNDNGSAYLFLGNTKKNMDAVCDFYFRGEDARNEMGSSLELFDIDDDGYSEVIVGARFAKTYHGAVYLWWGGEDFDGNRPADVVLEGEPGSNMGGDSIVCGYFNGDRYGDILTGGYNYPGSAHRHGRAYLFYGSNRLSMDVDCDQIFTGKEGKYHYFGVQISCGDVNNDGYSDALIGEPGYLEFQGRAYLYYGPFENTTDITFNWNTTNATPGKHILKATIAPVEGEEDVADNAMTMTVEVKEKLK